MSPLTLIEAQQRYIQRVNGCHPGHLRRVTNSAWKELATWAKAHEHDPAMVCRDADDMAKLERNSEE
jgi:hypothetical protein